jgi:CDP-paratose 2-epimerase
MKKLIVTGSSGLIGSEVGSFFPDEGFEIHGVDNNQRAVFFGTLARRAGINAALNRRSKSFDIMNSTSAIEWECWRWLRK